MKARFLTFFLLCVACLSMLATPALAVSPQVTWAGAERSQGGWNVGVKSNANQVILKYKGKQKQMNKNGNGKFFLHLNTGDRNFPVIIVAKKDGQKKTYRTTIQKMNGSDF